MEAADDDESSPTNPKRLHSANIRIPFSFVTVDPGDQSKRKGNALVRAHVSRVSWTKARRSEHKLERAHHRHLVPKEKASKWRVRDTSRTDPANASSHFLERLPDEGAITICLPTTNLGTGSFDPFETYPSSLPSEVVNPLIDQGQYERSMMNLSGFVWSLTGWSFFSSLPFRTENISRQWRWDFRCEPPYGALHVRPCFVSRPSSQPDHETKSLQCKARTWRSSCIVTMPFGSPPWYPHEI